MIEMSDSIQELAAALSKAQARIRDAVNAKNNEDLGTTYADLSAVWAACRDALTRNGLSVLQFPGAVAGNFLSLTTILVHASGQWIRQPLSIPLSRLDEQSYGAALTYARRYALAAVVGVCPQSDDSAISGIRRRRRVLGSRTEEAIDADQLAVLTALIDDLKADQQAFCDYIQVPTLSQLPAIHYEAAFEALQQKRNLAWKAA